MFYMRSNKSVFSFLMSNEFILIRLNLTQFIYLTPFFLFKIQKLEILVLKRS